MCSASRAFPGSEVSQASQATVALQAESCNRLTVRVVQIKQTLVARYRLTGTPENVIREAVASAEAQAWLSGFPHLFLPDLADEILEHLLQKPSSIHPEYAQAA